MSEVGRGAGLGFGLVLGILLAVVAVPAALGLLLCGGCATLVGTGAAVAPDVTPPPLNREPVARPPAEPDATSAEPDAGRPPEPTPPEPASAPGPEAEGPVISLEEYGRLEPGISYEQANGVVGEPGEELARTRLGGAVTVIVAWKNPDGSNANVTFRNDVLVQRAQFGLRPEPPRVAPPPRASEPKAAPPELPPGRPATAAEAGQIVISAEAEAERRRSEEAARRADEKSRREVAAAAELNALLAAPDLSTAEAVEAVNRAVADAAKRFAGTPAEGRARRESSALAKLRLALVARERGLDPASRLREVVKEFSGTAAAKAAERFLVP